MTEIKRKYKKRERTEYISKYCSEWRAQLRLEVLTHYGNDECRCVQCGESRLACLTIDHIDGHGEEHRRSIGNKRGSNFWKWLKDNEYPKGFQTLCLNCQMVKRVQFREERKPYGGQYMR